MAASSTFWRVTSPSLRRRRRVPCVTSVTRRTIVTATAVADAFEPGGGSLDIEVATVDVGGRRIGYRRAGAGPPLLLLHGAWSDGREWRRQLEALSDDFTVVAWDAPGCGASFDPPDEFPLAAYADAVAGLVDALGVEQPHLLGLSFGGGLALEVYHRHPALPRSLILASAYAGWTGSLPPEEVADRVRRLLEEADRPAAEWAASYLPGFFAGAVPQR